MKIKIVGVEPKTYNFENDKGDPIHTDGRIIHYSYNLQSKDSVGVGCNNCYVSFNKSDVDFKIGQIYWCDNYKGRLSNFELIDKT